MFPSPPCLKAQERAFWTKSPCYTRKLCFSRKSRATFLNLFTPNSQREQGKYTQNLESKEKKLVKGCIKKDAKAQRQLYDLYKVPLFRVCLRYAKDRLEAEDMLQDGFIKIFSDIHQYRGDGALGGWLRRVMVNIALQHLRKQKKYTDTVEIETIADTHQAGEHILSDLRAKALTQLIQKLPAGYRAVFNMYVIEGYSHKEIAALMNFTTGTSKSQLSKAKAMLRKMLEHNLVG